MLLIWFFALVLINFVSANDYVLKKFYDNLNDSSLSAYKHVNSLYAIKSSVAGILKTNSDICIELNIKKDKISIYDLKILYESYKCENLKSVDLSSFDKELLLNFHDYVFFQKSIDNPVSEVRIIKFVEDKLLKPLDILSTSLILHLVNEHIPSFRSAQLDSSIKNVLKNAKLIDDSLILISHSLYENIFFFKEWIKFHHISKSLDKIDRTKLLKILQFLRQAIDNHDGRIVGHLVNLAELLKKIDSIPQIMFVESNYYSEKHEATVKVPIYDILNNPVVDTKIQVSQVFCDQTTLDSSKYIILYNENQIIFKLLMKQSISSCKLTLKNENSKNSIINLDTITVNFDLICEFSSIKLELNNHSYEISTSDSSKVASINLKSIDQLKIEVILKESLQIEHRNVFLTFINEEKARRFSFELKGQINSPSNSLQLKYIKNFLDKDTAKYSLVIAVRSSKNMFTYEFPIGHLNFEVDEADRFDDKKSTFFKVKDTFQINVEDRIMHPYKIISILFTVLIGILVLLLLKMWFKIGFNSISLKLTFWESLFHASTMGLMISYGLYWLFLNFFQMMKLFVFLSIAMLFFGKKMIFSSQDLPDDK